ncbi:hypothetical protein KKI24_09175 [bacterium]|nr:hypothetical protein [bacterium]
MGKLKRLKGIIIPCDWDQLNNVTMIALTTAGEHEYRINMDGMGKSLLNHIRSPVQMEGVLDKRNKDDFITVCSYKVLNWA